MILVGKVDGHQTTDGGSGLIHQAAGLAEEDILGVLADLGDLRLGDPAIEEHVVDDGADEDLVGGGGAQAGTGQNGGLAVGVEALHLAAHFGKLGGHASDQGGGGVDFRGHGLQLVQAHLTHGVALGLDADDVGAVGTDGGHGVEVDSAGQHATALVVGVVAGDLGTAGGREITLRRRRKDGRETCIQRCLLGRI